MNTYERNGIAMLVANGKGISLITGARWIPAKANFFPGRDSLGQTISGAFLDSEIRETPHVHRFSCKLAFIAADRRTRQHEIR